MNVDHEESFSISTSTSTKFSEPLHIDEKIRELLSVDDLPWEDLHHRSSFLPELDHFENDFSSIFTTDYVKEPQNPLQHPDFELNLGNISKTVPMSGHMKKCQESIYQLLSMKLKLTRMLNLSDNICVRYIQEKLLLLTLKLRNYFEQVSFI